MSDGMPPLPMPLPNQQDQELQDEIIRVALIWFDMKRPQDELQYRALLSDTVKRLHQHRS